MQSARSIDNHSIKAFRVCVLNRFFSGFRRFLRTAFEHFGIYAFPDDLQLVDRRGSVDIARNQQRLFTLLNKVLREFPAHSGLARAL